VGIDLGHAGVGGETAGTQGKNRGQGFDPPRWRPSRGHAGPLVELTGMLGREVIEGLVDSGGLDRVVGLGAVPWALMVADASGLAPASASAFAAWPWRHARTAAG